jgi:dimethylamine monooxygenase subunit A
MVRFGRRSQRTGRHLMRPLPPETIHLPFEAGPYRMAMGLTTAAEADWFEIDALYPAEMAQRRHLLATIHNQVFAALPSSDAARREALDLVVTNLTHHHPGWFDRSGSKLDNRLTGEIWDLSAPSPDPLELAGRLVQEDLCLIQSGDVRSGDRGREDAGKPIFTAGVLCFPSRWRLGEKIGRPLADVHGPVPFYAERLARPVDRFMAHVKAGHIATRLNWSVLDDPALFQPGGKWRSGGTSAVTGKNAGELLFLRVERQTLRRLPASGAILFGIRVHNHGLGAVLTTPAISACFAAAVRALPPEVLHYKSVLPFRTALLEWLDGRAAA